MKNTNYSTALGEPNEKIVLDIHQHFLNRCPPDGLVRLIGNAFKAHQDGDFDMSISQYTDFIKAQDVYVEFHFFAIWQRMWVYAAASDWVAGAREAEQLKDRCPWSPTLFHYLYYGFALMANEGTLCEKRRYFDAFNAWLCCSCWRRR